MPLQIDAIQEEIAANLYLTGIPESDNDDCNGCFGASWNMISQKNYPDKIEYEFECSGVIAIAIDNFNGDLIIKDTRPWSFGFDDCDWSPGDPHYIYFKLINGHNEYGGCPEMTFDIPSCDMHHESENSYSMNENKFKTKQDVIDYFAAKGVPHVKV